MTAMTFNQQTRPAQPLPTGTRVLTRQGPGTIAMPLHYRGELIGYVYSVRIDANDRTFGYGPDEISPLL